MYDIYKYKLELGTDGMILYYIYIICAPGQAQPAALRNSESDRKWAYRTTESLLLYSQMFHFPLPV